MKNPGKISISDDVWSAIEQHGKFGETPNDVVRRQFGISSLNSGGRGRGGIGRRGRGNLKLGDKILREPRLENGRFFLQIADGPSKEWLLPAKTDKASIRRLRDDAVSWGRAQELTEGQINAIKKGLTKHGYHVQGPRKRKP